jgi:SAM-dependent methyltransferase
MSRNHYSYTVYADPATAQSFDDRRFGGPIGRLIADEQARVLDEFAGNVAGKPVIDVGTGTGRAAIQMARRGARVTGVDASDPMLAVARTRAADERLEVRFVTGDAHELNFPDRAFDVAISLRVLMHTPDWRRSLDELCRVSSRLVIFDYPAAMSFAALQSAVRRMTHALGARTEPYRVFTDASVERALDAQRFRVRSVHRQFVLPIAAHKAIGSPGFSRASRSLSQRTGLLGLIGTPVTVAAERCES